MSPFTKKTADWLIIGLGNPGAQYASTRHNAGFLAIERLAQDWQANYWKLCCNAQCAEIEVKAMEKNLLAVIAKPQTFMNRSGFAVKGLLKYYHASTKNLIVIHDDLDIEEHVMRLKLGGGHGGHNGLRDINNQTGNDYVRVRVGIGRPPGLMPADRYVLQPLNNNQLEALQIDARAAASATEAIIKNGFVAAQNQFNQISR